MKIDILTLFPKMFQGPFEESIVKRAQDKGLVEIKVHDLRQWGLTERRTVDDRPYGGGTGMLLRVDVVDAALQNLKLQAPNPKQITNHLPARQAGKSQITKVTLLDATGKTYTQEKARELAKIEHLILIAGHYEGVDHRVHEHLVDEVISIGNYVLTGGEIPAMVIVDSLVRLIPGVLEKPEATQFESFSLPTSNLQPPSLEHPQYTRPEEYHGWKVPKVLLSGNHKEIEAWRKKASRNSDS